VGGTIARELATSKNYMAQADSLHSYDLAGAIALEQLRATSSRGRQMSEAKYKCTRLRCDGLAESPICSRLRIRLSRERKLGCPKSRDRYERACDEEGCWIEATAEQRQTTATNGFARSIINSFTMKKPTPPSFFPSGSMSWHSLVHSRTDRHSSTTVGDPDYLLAWCSKCYS